MQREFALGDIYLPSLLIIFLVALVLNWGVSWAAAKFRLSRFMWHEALFHIALFACIFTSLALFFY